MKLIARCTEGNEVKTRTFWPCEFDGMFAEAVYDMWVEEKRRFKALTGGSPVMNHFDVLDSAEDVEDGTNESGWFNALKQWEQEREQFVCEAVSKRLDELNDELATVGGECVNDPGVKVCEIVGVEAENTLRTGAI